MELEHLSVSKPKRIVDSSPPVLSNTGDFLSMSDYLSFLSESTHPFSLPTPDPLSVTSIASISSGIHQFTPTRPAERISDISVLNLVGENSTGAVYLVASCQGNKVFFYSFHCDEQKLNEIQTVIIKNKEYENEPELLQCLDASFQPYIQNSHSENIIVAVGGYFGFLYILCVEEKETEIGLRILRGHTHEILLVKFFPKESSYVKKENLVLSASKDGTLVIWNIKTEIMIAMFKRADTPLIDISSFVFTLSPFPDWFLNQTGHPLFWKVHRVLCTQLRNHHLGNFPSCQGGD